MAKKTSIRHLQIDKTQTTVLIAVAVASVISIFCLVSAKSLLSKAAYQRRVLHARREAVKQLKSNIAAADQLVTQYKVFSSGDPRNVIGGKNVTDPNVSPPDGDNSRIVLDALPSTYDFPALITSMAKILSDQRISSANVGGSDQSATIDNSANASPKPQTVTLTITGTSDYNGIQRLLGDFERSIRPFDIISMQLQGSAGNMNLSASLNTYFQPAKSLNIGTTKEVK